MQDDFEPLNIGEILDILPHRYPFILVDRVTELDEGEFICGLKNVTMNENFFQGHFPAQPVMPGVLIVEALAQLGAIMAYQAIGDAAKDKLVYFAGIDKVKFRRKVEPGDQLILKVRTIKRKLGMWSLAARAEVDGQLAVEANLMATIR
ncbi:MAG TPA: 3-hydroxyacyl-ACP dehydratase FabZ [Desulfobacterales bacterium]|nr:3-hydroxyacyl-ACP dehydratase FabZ [Desulfobacterales bacterium]